MTLTRDQLLPYFEDLLELDISSGGDAPIEDDDDEETIIHKLDASTLTLTELLNEMERRGLQARGFFADDAKVLQTVFDKEHENYMELKRKEKSEARALEAKRMHQQRRKMLIEKKAREEQVELENDIRIQSWLRLMESGLVPPHSQIDINNITARSVVKALWVDTTLLSLDVSNMELYDLAGTYLSRALKNNRVLRKIDLGCNSFGPNTCKTLGDSLTTNNVLVHVNLESNPLTAKNDLSGVEAIAKMLKQNKSLTYFSLWRCGIGIEGGKMISDAVVSNDSLTCFELGYNTWESIDICRITAKLVR